MKPNSNVNPHKVRTASLTKAEITTMRLVEIRSYKLKAKTSEAFHRLVCEESAPMLRKWGTDVVAFGISQQEEDEYFLIRSYKDLTDLKSQQDEFYGSREWRSGPREAIVEKIESSLNTTVWLSAAGVEDLRTSNMASRGSSSA